VNGSYLDLGGKAIKYKIREIEGNIKFLLIPMLRGCEKVFVYFLYKISSSLAEERSINSFYMQCYYFAYKRKFI